MALMPMFWGRAAIVKEGAGNQICVGAKSAGSKDKVKQRGERGREVEAVKQRRGRRVRTEGILNARIPWRRMGIEWEGYRLIYAIVLGLPPVLVPPCPSLSAKRGTQVPVLSPPAHALNCPARRHQGTLITPLFMPLVCLLACWAIFLLLRPGLFFHRVSVEW
jgi:hypothetical protein